MDSNKNPMTDTDRSLNDIQPESNTTQPDLIVDTHAPTPNRKHIFTQLFIVSFILVGTVATLFSIKMSQDNRSKATITGPVLSLSPATKPAVLNSTFSVGIILNTNTDSVSAADIRISYDPTAVEIMSFTPGIPLPVILVPETHGNGMLSVILGAEPTTPFQGSNIIGAIQVKMIAVKTSTINFTSDTIVTSVGKTGNTLMSTTGTTITIPNTPTSTLIPTRTPTPGVTRTPTPTQKITPTPTPTKAPAAESGTCSVAPGATCSAASQAGCTSSAAIRNKSWCLEYGPSCCKWTPD